MRERDLTVAIIAGGNSERFGSYKALAPFKGKPLIKHMVKIARHISERVLIVVSNTKQSIEIKSITGNVIVVVDPPEAPRCALTGALTAFEFADTRNTLLLPVDTPLARVEILQIISELAGVHGAVIPTWPNGYIEPLHSVYHSEHAYSQGLKVISEGRYKMQDMIGSLKNVLGVSTHVLKQFDPDLLTFQNINTKDDLRKLERLIQRLPLS